MQLSLLNVLLKIPLSETFLFEEDLFPNASKEDLRSRREVEQTRRKILFNSFKIGDKVRVKYEAEDQYGGMIGRVTNKEPRLASFADYNIEVTLERNPLSLKNREVSVWYSLENLEKV
jgi:hypothetical protein